jgi:hypothetical protein
MTKLRQIVADVRTYQMPVRSVDAVIILSKPSLNCLLTQAWPVLELQGAQAN